ncbi:MAG: DUF6483 family protein [Clostridium sp.]
MININIEELINELAKNTGKSLLQKEEDNNEIINLDEADSSDYIRILLKSLVLKHEYNKAENILFEEIKKNKSEKIYKIALDFYDLLMDQSDDKLKNGNFSREEIFQGLKDVNIIFNKESLTTI